jgi:hypothetical protein
MREAPAAPAGRSAVSTEQHKKLVARLYQDLSSLEVRTEPEFAEYRALDLTGQPEKLCEFRDWVCTPVLNRALLLLKPVQDGVEHWGLKLSEWLNDHRELDRSREWLEEIDDAIVRADKKRRQHGEASFWETRPFYERPDIERIIELLGQPVRPGLRTALGTV